MEVDANPVSSVPSSRFPVPSSHLRGERIALGPIGREHVACFYRWFNDLRTLRTAGIGVEPRTLEDAERWVERIASADDGAWFIVYEVASWRAIGFASLRDIDERNRTAEYAITIGESEARGKGYGTEVTRLMLDYAFSWRGLHTVLLDVVAHNIAGIRAYERAGFREIGRIRQSDRLGGQVWDTVLMEAVRDVGT